MVVVSESPKQSGTCSTYRAQTDTVTEAPDALRSRHNES
ncbi:hypothetical protein HMPREF9948_0906 [Propionibacterium sp. 434-HC2]|nr:hypothetical protein HMPREF9948_0906 [Propionibacterium sp. 434-HC2]